MGDRSYSVETPWSRVSVDGCQLWPSWPFVCVSCSLVGYRYVNIVL